jgi:RNA polymerase sigma-70 factor (ECF subfamily)
VRRLRRGDEEAYRLLLELYGGRMLRAAKRVLRDEEEALDARQDALLSLVRALDGFSGRALVATWLHKILLNTCRMRLRRRRQRGPTLSLEDGIGVDALLAQARDRHAPALWESEERLQSGQARRRVRALLAALPERYRAVVVLRDLEELTTREAARVLGISENAVKVRLHRARRAARALLEEEGPPGQLLPWR